MGYGRIVAEGAHIAPKSMHVLKIINEYGNYTISEKHQCKHRHSPKVTVLPPEVIQVENWYSK